MMGFLEETKDKIGDILITVFILVMTLRITRSIITGDIGEKLFGEIMVTLYILLFVGLWKAGLLKNNFEFAGENEEEAMEYRSKFVNLYGIFNINKSDIKINHNIGTSKYYKKKWDGRAFYSFTHRRDDKNYISTDIEIQFTPFYSFPKLLISMTIQSTVLFPGFKGETIIKPYNRTKYNNLLRTEKNQTVDRYRRGIIHDRKLKITKLDNRKLNENIMIYNYLSEYFEYIITNNRFLLEDNQKRLTAFKDAITEIRLTERSIFLNFRIDKKELDINKLVYFVAMFVLEDGVVEHGNPPDLSHLFDTTVQSTEIQVNYNSQIFRKSGETTNCMICFREIENGDSVLETICCEQFGHLDHISIWFNYNDKCPYCSGEAKNWH